MNHVPPFIVSIWLKYFWKAIPIYDIHPFMLVYFLQLLAIVVGAAAFLYVGDNSKGLRGHHLLHQKL